MQFYLCQTPDGEQLAGSQLEAKGLDKNFVPLDLPTDKPGLMSGVNRLLKRAAGVREPVAVEEAPVVVPLNRVSKVPNGCPQCDRTPMGALKLAQSATAMEITDRLDTIDQDYLLRNIIEAAQERLATLQKKVA